jgi:hypothetical protein
MEDTRRVTRTPKRATKTTRTVKRAVAVSMPPQIGSAAADWSRWPTGTLNGWCWSSKAARKKRRRCGS